MNAIESLISIVHICIFQVILSVYTHIQAMIATVDREIFVVKIFSSMVLSNENLKHEIISTSNILSGNG